MINKQWKENSSCMQIELRLAYLGPVLFHLFVNDPDFGVGTEVGKITGDTKLLKKKELWGSPNFPCWQSSTRGGGRHTDTCKHDIGCYYRLLIYSMETTFGNRWDVINNKSRRHCDKHLSQAIP